MIKKETTKDLLTRSAMDLLSRMPEEKITVRDITDNCSVSRKTFYNYFADKYDCYMWSYEQTLLSYFQEISPQYPFKQAVYDALEMLKSNWTVLKKISEGQMLFQYADGMKNSFIDVLSKYYGPLDERSVFYIDYTCTALVSMVSKWLESHRQVSGRQMCDCLCECVPENLKNLFINAGLF